MKKNATAVVLTGRAKAFKELFLKSGLGQGETSRRLEVSPGTVSGILNGKAQPSGRLVNSLRTIVEEVNGGNSLDSDLLPLSQSLSRFEPEVRRRMVATLQVVVEVLSLGL